MGIGTGAARHHRRDRQAERRDDPAGLGHLGGGHLFEIEAAQPFLPAGRVRGVNLDLDLFAGIRGGWQIAVRPVKQRLGRAFLGGAQGPVLLRAAHRGQQHRHHLFEIARVAPEETEDLVEHVTLFGAADEAGMEDPVEILFLGEAYHCHRANGVDRAAGPDGQACLAQGPCEPQDVVAQPWVFRKVERGVRLAHRAALGGCDGLGAAAPARLRRAPPRVFSAKMKGKGVPFGIACRSDGGRAGSRISSALGPRGPVRGCARRRPPGVSGCRLDISGLRPACPR